MPICERVSPRRASRMFGATKRPPRAALDSDRMTAPESGTRGDAQPSEPHAAKWQDSRIDVLTHRLRAIAFSPVRLGPTSISATVGPKMVPKNFEPLSFDQKIQQGDGQTVIRSLAAVQQRWTQVLNPRTEKLRSKVDGKCGRAQDKHQNTIIYYLYKFIKNKS